MGEVITFLIQLFSLICIFLALIILFMCLIMVIIANPLVLVIFAAIIFAGIVLYIVRNYNE